MAICLLRLILGFPFQLCGSIWRPNRASLDLVSLSYRYGGALTLVLKSSSSFGSSFVLVIGKMDPSGDGGLAPFCFAIFERQLGVEREHETVISESALEYFTTN